MGSSVVDAVTKKSKAYTIEFVKYKPLSFAIIYISTQSHSTIYTLF